MADIIRFPLIRHLRSGPTTHIRYLKKGRLVREGVGQAFWFRPLTAALSEVPVDDREVPLLFHARTADFQDVSIQATITYRIEDPGVAATRIAFGIDPDTGRWREEPLEHVTGLLTELAQQHVLDLIVRMPLADALSSGVTEVRERLAAGLAGDRRLSEIGLVVVAVRVVSSRAEPDIERALQTPTREQLQQEADRATYERRAVAVERERAIAENELQSQIELSRREEDLVVQRGANERRRSEEAAAAARIDSESEATRTRVLSEAKADATRVVGAAEAAAEAERLAAFREVDTATLVGLSLRDLAGHLPEIGALTITPELLTPLLARLDAEGRKDER
jgi:regulator of protease activity HflC (stomatin/prohibitin superfamily)